MKAQTAGSERQVFDEWESSSWLPPKDQTIDEWAEENIVLPRGVSAIPGPLNLSITPYLREPLRAFTDPETEEITCCFSTQVGKTLFLMLAVSYSIAEDPWPCMVVMPREKDAVGINVERFQKIVRESPALSKFLTGEKKDMNREAVYLNGVQVNFSWATSPSAVSSRPVCLLVCDETDKWPHWSGREADPLKLARERTRSFHNRKICKTSTPTTDEGYIWRELKAGTNERFHVPCTHCGHHQELVMGSNEPGTPGIKWPKEERDPDRIVDEGSAYYECAKCHGRIDDRDKRAMLQKGKWRPKDGETISRRRRSFHLWAAYSPFLTFSEIAAEFLRSTRDGPAALMNFINSWLAQVWKEKLATLEPKHLKARIKSYERGSVPPDAVLLTAGIDVQADHFWYAIRAWGLEERSWLIRWGVAHNWRQLEDAILRTQYEGDGGRSFRVQRALIDSGYRTEEVYQWSSNFRPVTLPTKGSVAMNIVRPVELTKPKAGVLLLRYNANFWKDKLHRLIGVPDGETGEWNLFRDVSDTYLQHMVSERRVFVKKNGRKVAAWETVSDRIDNHLWDCEVLNIIAADVEGVEFLAQRTETTEMDDGQERRRGNRDSWLGAEDGDWFDSGKEWL